MTPHKPIAVEVDSHERLGPDDQATLREEQFRAAALAAQQQVAQAMVSQRGVCSYCRAICLPLAVYCDDECRRDHEEHLQVLRRQGRAR